MNKVPITLTATIAMALALSACQLREDGATEPDPAATEEPVAGVNPGATPGATPGAIPGATPGTSETPEADPAETPVVSIIRDEARSADQEIPVAAFKATVPFGDSGNDLSEQAERVLSGVLESAALREGWPVILRGHTDSSGNDSANLRASRSRAEAVAAWLVERGVDDERIEVIAFGEQNPIAPNANPDGSANEQGRARNRRVDIEIAPKASPRRETGLGTN